MKLFQHFFDWELHDQQSSDVWVFYSCTLKQDIGGLKSGTKASVIEANFNAGKLEIFGFDEKSVLADFEIKVT